jgi:nitric oxide synthase oxygenase domain/subunit
LPGQVDPAAAQEFLELYEAENPKAGPIRPRVEEVRAQIERYGTYVHTAAELTFGAQAAWRNSSRCIGRLYWRSLRVRDRRHLLDAGQVTAVTSSTPGRWPPRRSRTCGRPPTGGGSGRP